jgi:hypothetical protein
VRYKCRRIGLKVAPRLTVPADPPSAAPTSAGKSAKRPAAQPTPKVTKATHAGGFCTHMKVFVRERETHLSR